MTTAAQDLLGVLTRLVRRIDQGEHITPDRNIVRAAHAAIAKARAAKVSDPAPLEVCERLLETVSEGGEINHTADCLSLSSVRALAEIAVANAEAP